MHNRPKMSQDAPQNQTPVVRRIRLHLPDTYLTTYDLAYYHHAPGLRFPQPRMQMEHNPLMIERYVTMLSTTSPNLVMNVQINRVDNWESYPPHGPVTAEPEEPLEVE